MESEDEDVSETDILDWYKSEVEDIWDTATDSAFADLSSNFTEMFRKVMNDVKQRSTQQQAGPGPSTSSAIANGHSSTSNSHQSDAEPIPSTSGTNTVALSSDQLMAMLEDDDDWADEALDEEEMMLSVQLTDDKKPSPTPPTTEEDQKNVKGVSREVLGHFAADSALFVLIQTFFRIIKWSFILLSLILAIYTASLIHNPLQRWFLRQAQDFIYPSMRLLRLATLPLIQLYPWLTDFHEEMCLIENPLYRQRELDCRSCADILDVPQTFHNVSVIEFQAKYYHSGVPLLLRGLGDRVSLEDVRRIYSGSRRQFLQGIGRFSSTQFDNVSHFLEQSDEIQGQVSWKINRVGAGRLFRRLFRRPGFIPQETEVALHKYVYVDGSRGGEPYRLPVSEFANVWVAQGSGSRRMRLEPTGSCADSCSLLEATLHSGDILFYNWQFWDPRSEEPEGIKRGAATSLTYVGSFY